MEPYALSPPSSTLQIPFQTYPTPGSTEDQMFRGEVFSSHRGSLESKEVRLVTPPMRLASTVYADKLKRVYTNTLVRVK